MHFVDVKKVYFHKIVLDEWKGMNFMDFNQLHSFLIFIQIEWILWKLMNLSKLNDQRYSYHSHVQSKNLLRFQHSFSVKIVKNENLFKINRKLLKKNEINENWIKFDWKSKLSLNDRKMKNDEESSTINDLISLLFNY